MKATILFVAFSRVIFAKHTQFFILLSKLILAFYVRIYR